MAKKTLRITIPRNVGELLELGEKIYTKHQGDGTNSPLKGMQDYNWDTIGPNVAPALAKHTEAEDLKKKMEIAYEQRDALVADIKGIVTSTRDVLKGTFSKLPKSLGDWGFVVDDSPKAKPVKN